MSGHRRAEAERALDALLAERVDPESTSQRMIERLLADSRRGKPEYPALPQWCYKESGQVTVCPS